MSAFELSYILLWVVLCVLLVGVTALYSAFGSLTRGEWPASRAVLDLSEIGPPLGEPLEVPELYDLDGRFVRGARERWIFVTPECHGCERVKEMLRTATPAELGDVVIVCRGRRDDAIRWADDLPDSASIVLDDDDRLFSTFNITATPYFVLRNAAGVCTAKGMTDKTLARGKSASGGRSARAIVGAGRR